MTKKSLLRLVFKAKTSALAIVPERVWVCAWEHVYTAAAEATTKQPSSENWGKSIWIKKHCLQVYRFDSRTRSQKNSTPEANGRAECSKNGQSLR